MTEMTDPQPASSNIKKLPPIPKGATVQKRPLTRRQPPASSKSRIIYVSTSTPFMAAVKRVRRQLDQGLVRTPAAPKHASLQSRVEALQRAAASETKGRGGAVVTVMGTGRAVEKALAVASWFEQQGDCEVEVRTRTVGTVDDVVAKDNDDGLEGPDGEQAEDGTRLRRLSCLEVAIRLK